MKYQDLPKAVADAEPLLGAYGEFPVYVLDEDAFIHNIQYVTFDEDDECFYVSTKFVKEEDSPSV